MLWYAIVKLTILYLENMSHSNLVCFHISLCRSQVSLTNAGFIVARNPVLHNRRYEFNTIQNASSYTNKINECWKSKNKAKVAQSKYGRRKIDAVFHNFNLTWQKDIFISYIAIKDQVQLFDIASCKSAVIFLSVAVILLIIFERKRYKKFICLIALVFQ